MKSNPDEQDNTLRPLVALSRSRMVNNLSQFAEAASLLTVEKLQCFYDDEKANASFNIRFVTLLNFKVGL